MEDEEILIIFLFTVFIMLFIFYQVKKFSIPISQFLTWTDTEFYYLPFDM